MKLNKSLMTPKNSSPDFFSSSSAIPKPARQSSVPNATQKGSQHTPKQRRQYLSAINNDYVYQRTSTSLSVPLLINIMNTFFQTAQSMEDEIMLPSRLRDMPVEQFVLENTVQEETLYQVYSFIREMRNQLQSAHPFADDHGQNPPKEPPRKDFNADEGIIISNQDNLQFSCASSISSSDESEQSSASSNASSYDTIKDELKYHYYGLFRTLDNLTSLATHVTDKYRDEYLF